MKRVLLSWSSGKDSAWTLHVLRQQAAVELVGLLTTFNEGAGRVAMHAVRRELVEAQAAAAGLPLWPILLPWPCSNEVYEAQMVEAVERVRREGVTHIAFGDLFLEDIRAYRERQLAGTGIEPCFPSGGRLRTPRPWPERCSLPGLGPFSRAWTRNNSTRGSSAVGSMLTCCPNCRQASIRAGSEGSSTPSAAPGRCSRLRSQSVSARRRCATASRLPIC